MAYRLAIIDDNQTTVTSLLDALDWNALGIEIVGTAYDGLSGRSLICDVHPDILITDIQMPGMDGLSMLESLREELLETHVIIITAYEKFQYANRAIKLSVSDYILKPIDDDELLASVQRVIRSFALERHQGAENERRLAYRQRARLLAWVAADNAGLLPDSENVNPVAVPFCIVVCALKGGITLPLLRRLEDDAFAGETVVTSLVLQDELVLLHPLGSGRDNWKTAVRTLARRLLQHEPELVIGVSTLHDFSGNVNIAYREARQALSEDAFTTIDHTDCTFFKRNKEEMEEPPYASAETSDTVRKKNDAGGISVLVKNILNFAGANVVDSPRLGDVAQQFNITPNYLSTIIHKETGMTYREHLMLAKLNLATKLLDDTRMRVEEIARAVGYENYVSFYNIFKRQKGQTPLDYRFRNVRKKTR